MMASAAAAATLRALPVMVRRHSLVALCALLCTLASASVAEAGVKTFKLRTGPYRMENFNVRFPKHMVRAPRVDGYLVEMNARLVDAKGRVVTIRDVMLHHLVFKNFSRFRGRRQECRAPNGEAFWGTGEERQVLDLPEGYGYPVRKSDRWRMNVMLMGHGARARKVYVEYYGKIITGRKLKRVVPYWVGAHGCSSNPSYPVYGNGGPGSINTRSHDWRVPITGRIVAAGGHLHGGSKDMYVSQRRCGNRKLFDHKPMYGLDDHLYYRVKPVLHEPGPINTRWFKSETGIPVNRGETLRVTGVYDNEIPHPRVMAITHIYVHPTSKPVPGCKPLPADAVTAWRFKRGRGEPPKVTLPLYTLDDNLEPVQIERPPGPVVPIRNGGTVRIADFRFRPANIRVQVGDTLKWRFMDRDLHNVSFAEGPFLVGSRTLNNGAVDATVFRRVGRYKLFCYLHPMDMHQVVDVVPQGAL